MLRKKDPEIKEKHRIQEDRAKLYNIAVDETEEHENQKRHGTKTRIFFCRQYQQIAETYLQKRHIVIPEMRM